MSQNDMATAIEARMSPEQTADRELARRLARGEAGSFEELVELHAAAVTRTARGLLGWRGDVADVVQDVFVVALEKSPRFNGHCMLRTWLTVITLNRCRTWHRRHKIWRRVTALLGRERRSEPAAVDFAGLEDDTAREVRAVVLLLMRSRGKVDVVQIPRHEATGQTGTVQADLSRIRIELARLDAEALGYQRAADELKRARMADEQARRAAEALAEPGAVERIEAARQRAALLLVREAERDAVERNLQADESYRRAARLFPETPAGRLAAGRLKTPAIPI